MALSLATDLATLSLCEDSTDWSPEPNEDAVVQVAGTVCMAEAVKITTSALMIDTVAAADLTGKAIIMPQKVDGLTDTQANGGFRGYCSDGTNNHTWYLAGGKLYSGWKYFVFDPTSDGSTVDESAITSVGVQFKTLTTAAGQANNCFWDIIRYGSYLQCTSAVGDFFSLTDIQALDDTNAYGVMLVNVDSGAFIQQAGMIFGSTVSGDCDGKIENEIWTFPANDFVPAGFHHITIVGNAAGTTNLPISGTTIKSNNANGFVYDSTDANVDDASITGGTLHNYASVKLGNAHTITGVVFNVGTGPVEPNACPFDGNTVSNATVAGVKLTASHNSSNTKYTDNLVAITVDTAGDYTLDGDQFVDNMYDIQNTSTGEVNIYCTNGADASTSQNTNGGTTNIYNSNSLTITVRDETTKALLADARVHVVAGAGGPLTEGDIIIDAELTGADGLVVGTINGSGQAYIGLIAEASTPGLYVPKPISGTIPAGGASIDVGMVADE